MTTIKKIEKFIDIHRPVILLLSFICYFCLIYSLIKLPLIDLWKIFAIYYFVGIFEQIFQHRRFAHKSWHAPKWLDIIGLLISNQSLLGNSIVFSAQHRLHHKFADTKLDPHSPIFKNKFSIQFLYPYYKGSLKYVYDLLNDPIHIFFSKFGLTILITIWALISFFISFDFLILFWLPGIALVILCKNYLNSILHSKKNRLWNYKNFNTNDESKNNLFWGIVAFDGWHQNHHKYPNKWYLGEKWWEIDIPGILIGFFSIITFQFQNFNKKNDRL